MKTIETDIEKISKRLEEEGCRILTEEELRLNELCVNSISLGVKATW